MIMCNKTKILFLYTVSFLAPRRPNLYTYPVGHNWIRIFWSQRSEENILHYEVKYSYVGECMGVTRAVFTQTVSGSDSSYNITGLHGEHFKYSINLTAINGTGRSPPNIAFAFTKSEGIYI